MQALSTIYQIISMLTNVLVMLIIIQFIIGLLFAFNVVNRSNDFLAGFYMAIIRYGVGIWPLWLYTMMGVGIVMMLLFAHVYFVPFRRLGTGLAESDAESVRWAITQIRTIVGVNLCLGVIVAVSASAGRNW